MAAQALVPLPAGAATVTQTMLGRRAGLTRLASTARRLHQAPPLVHQFGIIVGRRCRRPAGHGAAAAAAHQPSCASRLQRLPRRLLSSGKSGAEPTAPAAEPPIALAVAVPCGATAGVLGSLA